MPTLEDFTDVYNIPEKEDPSYQGKMDVLLWYIDVYLVACVGQTLYNNTNRFYLLMSSPVVLPNEEDRVPMVPVEAEAFGWLMLENCLEKWMIIVPTKAKNPNWKIPQYSKNDESTHKYYKTKWTDAKTGKDQGGGWDPASYRVLASYMTTIQNMREADKKNGHPIQKMCLSLLQEKYGVTEKPPAKKRRRGDKKQKLAPVDETNFVLQVKDEFDDHMEVEVRVDDQGMKHGIM